MWRITRLVATGKKAKFLGWCFVVLKEDNKNPGVYHTLQNIVIYIETQSLGGYMLNSTKGEYSIQN